MALLVALGQGKMFFFFTFLFINNGYGSEMKRYSGTTRFHIRNNCNYKVWPAIVPEKGKREASSSGFELRPAGDSKDVFVPTVWSGSVWGRTGCTHDPTNGMLFRCLIGDCGTSAVECAAGNVSGETTVATVKLNGTNNSYYSVKMVDLPLTVTEFQEDDMSTPSTTYEFHFCSAPPLPTGVKPVNDSTSSQTRGENHKSTKDYKARNNHKFAKIMATLGKFILGMVIVGVTIAVAKYFCGCEGNLLTQLCQRACESIS